MRCDFITIGDAMRDIFVFPDVSEMEKPIPRERIDRNVEGEKFLLLEYGDKITISDIHYDVGGTACNVAVGLARLGLKTGIVSTVGSDSEGKEILTHLRKNKVSVTGVDVRSDKKTSFSVIISFLGDRSILVFHSFKPEDFELENLDSDWIFVGPLGKGYKSLYSKLTGLAAEKGKKIAINPGSVQIEDGLSAFGGLLRVAKVLFLNKQEAQKLANISGIATIKDIVKVLQKTGIETIVITDGKNGAYAATGEDFIKVGIYPGERVEPTGAGDSFAAAFLAATVQDLKLFDCLKWGVINSASVVGKIGAQEGLLSEKEIKSRILDYTWPHSSLRFS